jgi:hypothetical protein
MAEIRRLESKPSLPERLQQHPQLWARVEHLLDLVEGTEPEVVKAAEAERRVGEQLRALGQETLQAWAETRHDRQARYWEQRAGVQRKEKKDSTGTPATDG